MVVHTNDRTPLGPQSAMPCAPLDHSPEEPQSPARQQLLESASLLPIIGMGSLNIRRSGQTHSYLKERRLFDIDYLAGVTCRVSTVRGTTDKSTGERN